MTTPFNSHIRSTGKHTQAVIVSLPRLIRWLGFFVLTLYVGFWAGIAYSKSHYDHRLELELQKRLNSKNNKDCTGQQQQQQKTGGNNHHLLGRFPEETSGIVKGAVRVNKTEFLKHLDTGYASEQRYSRDHAHVLLLYQHRDALPPKSRSEIITQGTEIPLMGFEEATVNCHNVHVVSTKPFHGLQQCLALVGQYESYELDRFMRVNVGKGEANLSLPFARVGRGVMRNGLDEYRIPPAKAIERGFEFMHKYTSSIKRNLRELKPILKKIRDHDNTVIVMVSNYGQSELLINFVCRARAKQIDLSSVICICTDQITERIAKSLGLATYFDEKSFKDMSMQEAGTYGDSVFRDMMLIKVLAPQWVNQLGYHLLFLDLDVVLYKDPIPFFKQYHHDYDMVFQDDGARSVRFTPYSGNTGVYYIRSIPKTRYMMTRLVHDADFILSTSSHQQAMISAMNHHASKHGLRVKTLSMDPQLPCGFQYHRDRKYMMQLIQGNITPTLFHMAWTNNKLNKVLFFQQMGLWYVHQDKCKQSQSEETTDINTNITTTTVVMEKWALSDNLVQDCCLAEPKVTCHYRDKPSIIPCNGSPNIDPKGKPFWR